MATIKSTTHSSLSINEQHDYITLKTPNGNFTTSYGGTKASGMLAKDSVAFKALYNFMEDKSTGENYLEKFKMLLNGDKLSELWPGWNAPVPVNDFATGDTARFKAGGPFAKKYPGQYLVHSVKKKYVYLHTDKNIIGFDFTELEKV